MTNWHGRVPYSERSNNMADGNITAAKTKLGRSVARLIDPIPAVYHDVTMYAPCLYEQLASALPGSQGDSKTPAKSLPPLWMDAALLKGQIDKQAGVWARRRADTVTRLRIVRDRGWRPQDADLVFEMARMIGGWCEQIVALLDPQSVKTISAPCPSCGKATVYRRDSAGEVVRRAALQVVASVGCTCLHCEATWSPDRYLFLSRLLGFDLPEGVLE